MPNFQGQKYALVQPTTSGIQYEFKFLATSTIEAADGWIPEGATIDTVVVNAYDEDGTDATSNLIVGTPSHTGGIVTVGFQWPGAPGWYTLKFQITYDDETTDESDGRRVLAKDLS